MTPPGEKIEQASPATPLNCEKSFKYPARRKLREAKLMQHFLTYFKLFSLYLRLRYNIPNHEEFLSCYNFHAHVISPENLCQ